MGRMLSSLFNERNTLSDRKSTRLNSSHLVISYAVFCLKKKKIHKTVFYDVPNQEMLRSNNPLVNYEHEAAVDQLPAAGLSFFYVKRETRRAPLFPPGKPQEY